MSIKEIALNPIALGAAGWLAYMLHIPMLWQSPVPAVIAICFWIPTLVISIVKLVQRNDIPAALVGLFFSLPPLAIISYLLYFFLVQGGPDGAG